MKTAVTSVLLMGVAGAAIALSGVVHAPAPTSTRSETRAPAQFGALTQPVSAVFAPGTTPDQMVSAYQRLLKTYGVLGLEHLIGGAGLELEPSNSLWVARGFPVDLTYSFVPDGVATGQGANTIHATMTATMGDPLWKNRFAQALAEWSGVSGNTYTNISDDGAPWPNSPGVPGVRGDLRIVSAPQDGPLGVLAFNFFPTTGDMLLDNAENWGSGATQLLFRNTVTHEHGHGLGLNHVCPVNQTKIMEPFLNTSFSGVQPDDILAIQYQNGDAAEPNGNIAVGDPLEARGLVTDSTLTVNNLSLHAVGDFDVYTFDALSGSILNLARVIPTGATYNSGPQSQNGCSPGSPYDALRQIDVQIEVLSPTGSVIATANAGGLGIAEELTSIGLSADGTYGIRVRSGGANSGDQFIIQGYSLQVNVTIQTLIGDVSGDGQVNGLDISQILNVFGSTTNPALDLNNDGVVDGGDISVILNNWTG